MLDSASELLRLQENGEITAVEIAEKAISVIESSEKTINAFTYFDAEMALKAARNVDAKRAAGEPLGPLAGVPIAIKDNMCSHDMPTTCSSRMLANFRPPYDATVVTKLRDADAVIIGKTNLDEFAMGATTETSYFGTTRNPWDITRTPGGSSGGSAAAIAAGYVPMSLGSDTGGSIRQPAAFCGITGLKPTYGRVSRYGVIALASSLDQVGPMAWSAADVALLLQAIAGYEPRDSTSLHEYVPNYTEILKTTDLRGIKIGVLAQSSISSASGSVGTSPAVTKAVEQAGEVLRSCGAELVEIDLPHSQYWVPTYCVIGPCEASSNLTRFEGAHYGHRTDRIDTHSEDGPLVSSYCRSRGEGFGAEVKRRIMVGSYGLSEGYADKFYNQALKVRRLIKNDFDAAYAQCDLLLGPVTPSSAFRTGKHADDPLQMYLCDMFTVGANLAGLPAISLPGGFDDSGLPIGIQLQAPALQESRLLFAAGAFQSVTDHHKQRPS